MLVSDFDFHLPEQLIAQEPLPERAGARMLVLYRQEQSWEDRTFRELPQFLHPGDCLVLNNSRVFPSRLFGHRAGVHSLPVGKRNPARAEHLSGQVQVFLVKPLSADYRLWQALVRPGRKMAVGERIAFGNQLEAEIVDRAGFGLRTIRFEYDGDLWAVLDRLGHVPLPPYIKRPDTPADRERYQTVFAQTAGSVAAPTAGLHFTPAVLDECRQVGAALAYVTLHVGLGTFQPLHAEKLEDVQLHTESFTIDPADAATITCATRRIVVGTTSVRALESAARSGTLTGETDIFISPGFPFQRTDALLTNFHLPQSSLLILVSAFAGRDFTLAAYQHAVKEQYRFFSYGDCMLIL